MSYVRLIYVLCPLRKWDLSQAYTRIFFKVFRQASFRNTLKSCNFIASFVLIYFEYIVVLDEALNQIMFFFICCDFFEITIYNGDTCNCLQQSGCFNSQSSLYTVYNNQVVSILKVVRLCLRRGE